jgi:transporter family protein
MLQGKPITLPKPTINVNTSIRLRLSLSRFRSVWLSLRMNWFGWALLSAFFAALTAILAKVGVADINPNLATAIRTTVILLTTWTLAFFTSGKTDWTALTLRTWLFLTASGLMTGLSWLCYFRALKLGEVAKVAPVDKLSVAMAIILAVLFLGEKIKPQEAIGATLIVLGVVVMVIKL